LEQLHLFAVNIHEYHWLIYQQSQSTFKREPPPVCAATALLYGHVGQSHCSDKCKKT